MKHVKSQKYMVFMMSAWINMEMQMHGKTAAKCSISSQLQL